MWGPSECLRSMASYAGLTAGASNAILSAGYCGMD
ncbi:hypothetical protein METH_02070 [Leisingera methylohalidivorans DSM 14336]|uniref:Uncharacterized protein n=1 Tax=Leisingera methylohalidivorans DSM 14336 TaxID=999552 RepID=V9VYM9_9RHOB|nr:hypothetical protein METH_02070 [Leisingera methylohalidivorans DSM 14336]